MANSSRMDIEEVLRHFDQLEDPRSSINRRHPLSSVLVIAIMAVIAGANGPTARSYVLYQDYQNHVTQPLIREELLNLGIDISAGHRLRRLEVPWPSAECASHGSAARFGRVS